MKYLIANKNILIKTFKTDEAADEYIKTQKAQGNDCNFACEFEGVGFGFWELVEEGATEGNGSIWGVDWDNLIIFNEEYKKAVEERYKKILKETAPSIDYDDEIFGKD